MAFSILSNDELTRVPPADLLGWLETQLSAADPPAAGAAPAAAEADFAGDGDPGGAVRGRDGGADAADGLRRHGASGAGQFARARDFLAAERDRRPDDVDRARYHQTLALRTGRAAAVLADADARLAERPDDPVRLYLRGRLAATDAEALEDFDRALARDPDLSYANSAKAMVLAERGETDEALRLIEAAPHRPPGPVRPDRAADGGAVPRRRLLGDRRGVADDPRKRPGRPSLGAPAGHPLGGSRAGRRPRNDPRGGRRTLGGSSDRRSRGRTTRCGRRPLPRRPDCGTARRRTRRCWTHYPSRRSAAARSSPNSPKPGTTTP